MSLSACATQTPPLIRQVMRTIRTRRLFDPGMSLLVALSGGPDSVALLACLHRLAPGWRLQLTAVHFNYGLRGHESDEDEAFVTDFCRHRAIPLLVERPRLSRDAPRGRRSVQEMARELRYRLLEESAARQGCDRIALGHKADDQAETVLLWMLRGAGTTGLGGMRHDRRGARAHFIRPLLDCSRKAILKYLQSEGLTYRQDSSNQSRVYRRNRIRHDLLPLLQELNPAIVRVLCRQADLLAEDELVLEEETDRHLSHLLIKREPALLAVQRAGLLALPTGLQRRIIRRLLQTHHAAGKVPSLKQVSAVLNGIVRARNGASFRIARAVITRNSDQVIVTPVPAGNPENRSRNDKMAPSSSPATSLPLVIPSVVTWPPSGQRVTLRWGAWQQEQEPAVGKGRSLSMAFDAGRFTHALSLRSWQPGDSLCPAGMGGHRKKLQDLFTDMKIPRKDRDRVPILVAPEGILWVVGCRADQRFVPDAKTRQALIVEVETAVGR
ncbi:MAG TPA: tRNA lysidine(34) synthetase TilS [Nitrospiraceae bacterium]|nr:tRNA lysidine(34) synthetase TilS [Nitrospiraceae bacterium]